jgi:[protein-PII] uridylyltransferase
MRYLFAETDRNTRIKWVREGLEAFRTKGAAQPDRFAMHPFYDELISQVSDHFLGAWKERMAVVGLGGYGRKEMSPYSDVDLLFLKPDDAPEGVYRGIREILYMLWDAKIEMGHSVRTVSECRLEADKDLAVLTSLMDTRHIWGDAGIYRKLVTERGRMLLERDPQDLYLTVEDEIRKSNEQFGDTIYLLEPNVKEGPGSLRYVQLITWLGRMIFGASGLADLPLLGVSGRKGVEEVEEGLSFLAGVRTRLHLLAGRHDDRLRFDAQFAIAEQMGFIDKGAGKGVEHFMREYYRHAAVIDFFGRRIRAHARLFLAGRTDRERKRLKLDDAYYIGAGGINRYNPETMEPDPPDMLRAFLKIAETGCDLDIRLADRIRTLLRAIHTRWMDDPTVNTLFVDLFRTPGHVSKAITAVMKTGFLERFIPPFERVRFLRQYDAYHQYTVDLHTMMVLENIDSFRRPPDKSRDVLLQTIFARLDKPEVLYLGALFHDIGKGGGPGHEVRGEEISRPILLRLGLSTEDLEDVCFLVRNHLAMTHIALKKDLHDEELIGRFAETVIDKRRLDMLMLLTYADLRAVGPTAFNSWKSLLLEELYYRTLERIHGEGHDGAELGQWLRQISTVVRDMVPAGHRGPELEGYLAGAAPRYLLDFFPDVIAGHFSIVKDYLDAHGTDTLLPEDILVGKVDHPTPRYSAVTLLAKDRKGLFFKEAGTLSANRINILSAWSHSVGLGIAVATFHVTDIPEGILDDPERWDHFCDDMRKVIRGEVDVDELVAVRRRAGKFAASTYARELLLRVEVDNAASDKATIVEVYTIDRPGLLYDITRCLAGLELSIVLTKISTEADQVADIFYVVDDQGTKIVDFDRLEEIRTKLKDHLLGVHNEFHA